MDRTEKNNRPGRRRDRKGESDDSPEIPDRGEDSESLINTTSVKE